MTAAPSTIDELAEVLRLHPRVLPVGAQTKPRLSQVDALFISTSALSGILEYDPSEFTFTALAGTPLREIAAALAEHGQYLPFDPPLVEAGATLGGTVAAGLSGPGRFRYGGVRDFILGVRFIDGMGRVLRLGGKVVKNAAGFDLPKFFVGSLGRFGVLAEITFKVFPRAASFLTVKLPVADATAAMETMLAAANTRWELDALDYAPERGAVFARIGGPATALTALAAEIVAQFSGGAFLSTEEADALWSGVREFHWAHAEGVLVKIALTPKRLPELCAVIGAARIRACSGGHVACVSQAAFEPCFAGFHALTLRGDAPLFPGRQAAGLAAVKTALDPEGRFPPL